MHPEDHRIWQAWTTTLRRWGMQGFVAAFLEAAGPAVILGAQAIYIGQPLFGRALPAGQLDALARLFEDPHQTQSFLTLLREEPTP